MKSKKMKSQNNISKLLGALIIIFALTFSTNANAIASGQNIANSISLVITSANIATVTGDFQKKKKKKKRNVENAVGENIEEAAKVVEIMVVEIMVVGIQFH